jgi:uncharacterized protein YbjT (DUF2867 family)
VPFVALARDAARAEQLLGADVEVRKGDYDRPDTLASAFDGVGRVFLVAPLVPELAELPRQYSLHRVAEQHLETRSYRRW